MKKQTPLPEAAVALLFNAEGEVLTVSRKDNPLDVGLPGGKVDVGETPTEAVVRELEEETGLKAVRVRKIFSKVCGGEYLTHTYLIQAYEGEIHTRESGVVAWTPLSDLMSSRSCFFNYNLALLEHIGLVAYTIGCTRSYENALRLGPCFKCGAEGDGYEGGGVWKTRNEAAEILEGDFEIAGRLRSAKDFSVYGVVLPHGWGQDVSVRSRDALAPGGQRLLKDAPLFKLP